MAETDSRILEYLEEGLFLYGVGKVQESIVRWRKVLELDPRNERAMDYIESAGGDVSEFRAKAGAAKGAATAPAPAPVAVPAAAPAPVPAAPPPPPLDIGAFLAATGTAPAVGAPPNPTPRRNTPTPSSAPMPWQQQPIAMAAPSMPSITTSTTVPSFMTPPSAPPPPAAAPEPPPPVTVTVTAPSPVLPPRPPPPPVDMRAQLIAEAGLLFQSRAFEQSLEVLERVSREFPPVDDQLRAYLEAARNGLYEVLKQQWPRPDLIPEIRMNGSQVMQLKLSPEAGFILSRVDGVSTVEEILSMGGLDPFTTLRALSQLLRSGVIAVQS